METDMDLKYNGEQAAEFFDKTLAENEEYVRIFDDVSKKISEAFNQAGSIVSGTVGTACANCWGNGSDNFFKKVLLEETENFLRYKVEPILKNIDAFASDTTSVYENASKPM